MERLMTVVETLFFLFAFYVLWGPFAFFFASRSVVGRLRARLGPGWAATCAFVSLGLIFFPVVVAEPVGDAIPLIFPWWVAILGLWIQSGLEFYDASFVLAIPFVAVAAGVTFSQAFRPRDSKRA